MAAPASPECAPTCSISVVVPALNEEQGLTGTLAAIWRQGPRPCEVVVVDGGSVDATVAAAEAAGARAVRGPRGRARQMNAGAAECSGEVLLFLHADTELPPGALEAVERALANPAVLGGCFTLRFDAQEGSAALRLWSWCTRCWLLRTPRLVFGDRAIFVRRSVFEELGGYSDWPILEDLDFAMRLAAKGPGAFAFLPAAVTTSARRLLEVGPVAQQLLNTSIVILWYCGLSPETLKGLYRYSMPRLAGRTPNDTAS